MSTSNDNEWLHIYQNNLAGPPPPAALRWPDDITDATTTTTTTTTTSTGSHVSNQLGRVTRPVTNTRRRTRASRKTPTTLLNTDTTNFRAMVQQFTGGNFCGGGGASSVMASPATVAPRQQPYGSTNYSTGFGYYGTGSTISQPGGYNMEFRQPQQPQQRYYMNGGDHQHGWVQEGHM